MASVASQKMTAIPISSDPFHFSTAPVMTNDISTEVIR